MSDQLDGDDFILQQLGTAEESEDDLEAAAHQAAGTLHWDTPTLGRSVQRLIDRELVEGNVLAAWQDDSARVVPRAITSKGWTRIEQLRRQTDVGD